MAWRWWSSGPSGAWGSLLPFSRTSRALPRGGRRRGAVDGAAAKALIAVVPPLLAVLERVLVLPDRSRGLEDREQEKSDREGGGGGDDDDGEQ